MQALSEDCRSPYPLAARPALAKLTANDEALSCLTWNFHFQVWLKVCRSPPSGCVNCTGKAADLQQLISQDEAGAAAWPADLSG